MPYRGGARRLARKADVVIVLNSLAPWWPDCHKVNPNAKFANIGPDPIFSRYPVRNFRSDLTIASEVSLAVSALIESMRDYSPDDPKVSRRRKEIHHKSELNRRAIRKSAFSSVSKGITKEYVSVVLGDLLEGMNSAVFSELGAILGPLRRTDWNSWFQEPHSGGLGWSMPAAMGASLADPNRLCIATMGDGSYIFANPVACHQVAEAYKIPFLTIILNNAEWGAVRSSVEQLYPGGRASRSNAMPLTGLNPSPDFTLIAKANRAWARKVSDADQLEEVLMAALHIVVSERRQALVDVQIRPG